MHVRIHKMWNNWIAIFCTDQFNCFVISVNRDLCEGTLKLVSLYLREVDLDAGWFWKLLCWLVGMATWLLKRHYRLRLLPQPEAWRHFLLRSLLVTALLVSLRLPQAATREQKYHQLQNIGMYNFFFFWMGQSAFFGFGLRVTLPIGFKAIVVLLPALLLAHSDPMDASSSTPHKLIHIHIRNIYIEFKLTFKQSVVHNTRTASLLLTGKLALWLIRLFWKFLRFGAQKYFISCTFGSRYNVGTNILY